MMATVDKKAVDNTSVLLEVYLAKKGLFQNQVVFKDLRNFPEVQKNPEVFSPQVPVYFRVDLLRVIAAYNVVKKAAEEGRRHYFVYADIDVTSMSKEEIFDASTLMDLQRYGILMAQGGGNDDHFENSFQIWSTRKPNLLVAAQQAIINPSIRQAKNYLKGLKEKGNMLPIEESVYKLYPSMFRFFYHLEGWGEASEVEKLPDGQYRIPRSLSLKIKDHELILNKFIDPDDPEIVLDTLYIPRKIIDAPPSRFGGQPTQFNPREITPRNEGQKKE